jgi:hypothetical protein
MERDVGGQPPDEDIDREKEDRAREAYTRTAQDTVRGLQKAMTHAIENEQRKREVRDAVKREMRDYLLLRTIASAVTDIPIMVVCYLIWRRMAR